MGGKNLIGAAIWGGALLGIASIPAKAAYIVTFSEVGPDVVASGSGSINLAGLTFLLNSATNAGVAPNFGAEFTGPFPDVVFLDIYGSLTGPASFGPGNFHFASSGSGDGVGLGEHDTLLEVPGSYVSVPPCSTQVLTQASRSPV